jgi:hypothetical protein
MGRMWLTGTLQVSKSEFFVSDLALILPDLAYNCKLHAYHHITILFKLIKIPLPLLPGRARERLGYASCKVRCQEGKSQV